MKLFEYEAKQIFSQNGLPIPKGIVAKTPDEAEEAARAIGGPVVVKSQVLVGGRGKSGGIKFADTPEEAKKIAEQLLNMKIKGLPVEALLIEQKLDVADEIYAGITVDRARRKYVAITSAEGGVNIEEVAATAPEKIIKREIPPEWGLLPYISREMAKAIGLKGKQINALSNFLSTLWKIADNYDAELIEINPLIITKDNKFYAADARLLIDDNSLFRHKSFEERLEKGTTELNERELEALEHDMSYVELDGDVGIIGNGAGLVMATLDAVSMYGGKPANFLDVGGGAEADRMEVAIRIVLSNPNTKVLFINILGGITKCDEMAKGILAARDRVGIKKPMVIRLVGTNEEEGQKILKEAGIEVLTTLDDAAMKAVELAKAGE